MSKTTEREHFYKVLDEYFDAGWKSFVDEIRQRNKTSNERLFRVVEKIRGTKYVNDLQRFMKILDKEFALLTIVKNPIGFTLKDSRVKSIPEVIIDQRSSEGRMKGTINFHLIDQRFLQINF